ncbi:MAG: 3-keto-disaccharide hydrolase [Pirellulales bacterium]
MTIRSIATFSVVLSLALIVALACLARPGRAADEVAISIDAGKVQNLITRHMTGACIEDVNHEIYGGIYSQMIFGESFEEPAPPAPLEGFVAHGGGWRVRDGRLWAEAGDGPKLIATQPEFADGEVGVEVNFPDRQGGNAGLIVRVGEAGVGADAFVGYEIALDPARNVLVLGRHRHNWAPLVEAPVEIPTGQWIALVARVKGRRLEIDVAGKNVLKFTDERDALLKGTVGLRVWQRPAWFRNLWVQTAGPRQTIAFKAAAGTASFGEVSGMWRPIVRGSARGRFALESQNTFNGRQSQRITLQSGQGALGIENQSLNRWGMSFQAGKPYEGYLWVRSEKPAEVHVALESKDGATTYAETSLSAAAGDWRRLDFSLVPKASDAGGRFAVLLKKPGSVLLGHALLQPGAWGRFRDLPVRKDVAEGLLAQNLTVLRYGGSMVNAPEYRWKKMIGPRDRRPPYRGTWYPYSSNGWGIIDFMDFCEAAGFLYIPDFNLDETPQDMGDFVEYATGPAESPWGGKRAADGHPAPYKLRHVQIGNEEAVDEAYWRRFKPIAEAVWKKNPGITLVVGDFAYGEPIADPYNFPGAPRIKSLAAHRKILDLAKANGKPVWFDVHIGNDNPRDPDQAPTILRGLADWFARLSPGADFKICVFEENANNHAVRRALGHAHAINGMERIGDIVPILCAANCLQPYRQNDNGWNQGMLFLTPSQVWGQPPYYVTQMIAREWLPRASKRTSPAPTTPWT